MPQRRDPDEGPSDEDLDRFGEDSPVADARCPDCGAAVWSEADVCPKCYAFLDGDAPRPTRGFFARRWRTLVVVLLIVAMLTLAGIPVVQALIRP
ncbi:MAG: hypothetical protein ACOYO7_06605 [Phycisphaerales bacterium]